jgi:hypothetical protein
MVGFWQRYLETNHNLFCFARTRRSEEVVILFKGELDTWVCFTVEEEIERSQNVGLPAVISTDKYGELCQVCIDRLN